MKLVTQVIAIVMLMPSATAQEAMGAREGYYYPEITSEEVFDRHINNPPPASPAVRVAFITEINKSQVSSGHEPRITIFEKGSRSQHMVIVALDDEIFKTLYRARAVLASLTSSSRATEFFKTNNLHFVATWFDLAMMLGFEDIVISDGETWAHKVVLKK